MAFMKIYQKPPGFSIVGITNPSGKYSGTLPSIAGLTLHINIPDIVLAPAEIKFGANIAKFCNIVSDAKYERNTRSLFIIRA